MFRKLRRILVTLTLAGVGIVWLAMANLWIRSYWRGDVIVIHRWHHEEPVPSDPSREMGFIRRNRTFLLLSGKGGMAIAAREYTMDRGGLWPSDVTSWTSHESPGYPQPSSGIDTIAASREEVVQQLRLLGPTTMGSVMENEAIAPPQGWVVDVGPFLAYSAGNLEPIHRLGYVTRVIIFPYWLGLLILTLLTYLPVRGSLRNRQRRERAVKGCCIQCGYDLRASADRCPECGADAPSVVPN